MILTKREQEIIQLTAEGYTRQEIADKLFISFETVKKHLCNAYKKLGVNNKIEAMNKLKSA